jgi:uncharacterized membrane protein YccF (DUF307 family)
MISNNSLLFIGGIFLLKYIFSHHYLFSILAIFVIYCYIKNNESSYSTVLYEFYNYGKDIIMKFNSNEPKNISS